MDLSTSDVAFSPISFIIFLKQKNQKNSQKPIAFSKRL